MTKELSEFRRQYYELLAALLIGEPTLELISALQGQRSEARAEATSEVNATLGEGWSLLARYLGSGKDIATVVTELRNEYTQLFLAPAQPTVYPYESYYRGGVLLGEALLRVRAFLRQVGLEMGEGSSEPEDHVAVELDIMRQLITKGQGASGAEAEQWYRLQGTFVRRHLLPWVPKLCQDLEAQETAHFYRPVAKILRGFLELEERVLESWELSEAEAPAAPRVLPWTGPTIEVDEAPPADPG